MKQYMKKNSDLGGEYIEMTDDDGTIRFVPISDDNSDYQAYLATLVTESAPTA